MEKIKKVYIMNFGALLSDEIIEQIKEQEGIEEIEQIHIKRSLNLKKHSVYIQVHDIINEYKKYFLGNTPVIVNLPGLPIYVAALITEISALTSRLPIIVECIKEYSNGVFSKFKYKRLYNLDKERTCSRESYKTNSEREELTNGI